MMKRMIVSCALLLLCLPTLFAQTPPPEKPDTAHDCAAMMQQHEGMQKHMAEMDAKLQTMVDEMNKTKGSAKVDKMAAVITELLAQRGMMMKQMAEMHPKMMEHMMEHMKSGAMKGMGESMSNCPMMKEGAKSSEHQH